MEQMSNYKFISLQVALFFQSTLNSRSDQLSVEINNALVTIFDAPPLLFPVPDIAPGDIPFLQLRSLNNSYQCNVAKIRADFFFNTQNENNDKDLVEYKTDYLNYLNNFFNLFQGKTSIQRVGFITKHFIPAQSPSNLIRDKFISQPLGDCDELSLRFNRKQNKPSFEINDIISFEPAQLNVTNQSGVLVQRDINTIKERQYNIDQRLFQQFVADAEALSRADVIKRFLS